ncbi:DUF7218 family protein [Sphingomonas sp. PAMC 26617]|uniref:DUF7218 family protein n=1 Tax=Sphingomonas sp. PAMC 26617 TaxID=1112216 RepID=UPI003FA4063C
MGRIVRSGGLRGSIVVPRKAFSTAKDRGRSIEDDKLYEDVRENVASQEKAARIAGAPSAVSPPARDLCRNAIGCFLFTPRPLAAVMLNLFQHPPRNRHSPDSRRAGS